MSTQLTRHAIDNRSPKGVDMNQSRILTVQGTSVSVSQHLGQDYISLTDMLRGKDGDFFVSDWLRNRNTVEFLGIWESIYNASFNYGEFATIKNQSGLNSYKLSAKEWVEKTRAIGIYAKAGRYGGTYAHKDIAFEFGMWISPEFKLYLIKEFQRLKDLETKQQSLEWSLQRTLAKVNYKIHTDAIKEKLIPAHITSEQVNATYANEADLLNMALFGVTAAQWRDQHTTETGNMRDAATLEQLVVLSNLESINAVLIHQRLPASQRLTQLNAIAITQMRSLINVSELRKIRIQKQD